MNVLLNHGADAKQYGHVAAVCGTSCDILVPKYSYHAAHSLFEVVGGYGFVDEHSLGQLVHVCLEPCHAFVSFLLGE